MNIEWYFCFTICASLEKDSNILYNTVYSYLRRMELAAQIEQHKKDIEAFTGENGEAAESFRIKYLGTKGIVKNIMQEMKNVPADKKKEAGQLLNSFKQFAEEKYEALKQLSAISHQPSADAVDYTLPGDDITIGTRHPLSIVRSQIISIFSRIGFALAEGPEIEDDWHNFTSMNMPENHPARDMQDTFYVQKNPDWLLRTHTSSVQARVMETQKPPIRIICPGRVYRNETISARAHCFFSPGGGVVC